MRTIVGVLLAAGRSRRFGADKLLRMAHGGLSMAEIAAAKLLAVCDRALAVVGPQSSGELGERLRAAGLDLIVARDAERGMGASLAAAVSATPEAGGWLVALGDMPAIDATSMAAVAAALRGGASIAAPAHGGRRGHPVGFAGEWFGTLSRLTGERGGRDVIDAHPGCLSLIAVDDPGVLVDVDSESDLARLPCFDAPTPLG